VNKEAREIREKAKHTSAECQSSAPIDVPQKAPVPRKGW